jgi:hypothetical protein
MKRFVILILLALALGGCALWLPTDGAPFVDSAQNVSLELPAGWQRLNSKEFLFVTRDGSELQSLLVERLHVDDDLSQTRKKLARGMLPQELAEVILDNARSNEGVLDLKVLENKPVPFGDTDGFRMLYTYKSEDGLKYKNLYYGCLRGEWFYGVRYTASQRHYFERDLPAFEKAVKSFRVLGG